MIGDDLVADQGHEGNRSLRHYCLTRHDPKKGAAPQRAAPFNTMSSALPLLPQKPGALERLAKLDAKNGHPRRQAASKLQIVVHAGRTPETRFPAPIEYQPLQPLRHVTHQAECQFAWLRRKIQYSGFSTPLHDGAIIKKVSPLFVVSGVFRAFAGSGSGRELGI